ncbi:hypothetical protein [Roseinatronobacter ekhonensis]|uniref:hypothetical protein n=1 Tax=Roseinatronobacter ekhonensis TaxID=254356 RepID=UPI0016005459|nr:hypothetical protein [Roseibaca ekhonensis]
MTSFGPTPRSKESAEVQIDAAARRLIGLLAVQTAAELRAVSEEPTKERDDDDRPQK